MADKVEVEAFVEEGEVITTFWCVVALNYDRDGAPIVATSEEAHSYYDFHPGYDIMWEFDSQWVGEHPPGLYHLTIECVDDLPDKVIEAKCLALFPSLVVTLAANEYEAINQRMQEIQKGG